MKDKAIKLTPEKCAANVVEVVPHVMRQIRLEVRRQQAHNLSLPQIRALAVLREQPSASLMDVADYLGVSQATASATIERLVQRGLVKREVDPQERRRILLTLTETGEEQLSRAKAVACQTMALRFQHFSPEQLEIIIQAMGFLQNAVDSLDGSTR